PVDLYLRSNSKLHFAAPVPPQSDTHDTSECKNNRDTAKCCNIPYVSIVRSVRRGGCVPTPNNRADVEHRKYKGRNKCPEMSARSFQLYFTAFFYQRKDCRKSL